MRSKADCPHCHPENFPKTPAKGERYRWMGVYLTVLRVARDGTWADICCYVHSLGMWTKRQQIPAKVLVQWERLP